MLVASCCYQHYRTSLAAGRLRLSPGPVPRRNDPAFPGKGATCPPLREGRAGSLPRHPGPARQLAPSPLGPAPACCCYLCALAGPAAGTPRLLLLSQGSVVLKKLSAADLRGYVLFRFGSRTGARWRLSDELIRYFTPATGTSRSSIRGAVRRAGWSSCARCRSRGACLMRCARRRRRPADRLGVDPAALSLHGQRAQTRSDHLGRSRSTWGGRPPGRQQLWVAGISSRNSLGYSQGTAETGNRVTGLECPDGLAACWLPTVVPAAGRAVS